MITSFILFNLYTEAFFVEVFSVSPQDLMDFTGVSFGRNSQQNSAE